MKRFDPHSTERLAQLRGAELATFTSRALALALDVVIASLLFVLVMEPVETFILRPRLHLEHDLVFTFFGNWYSIAWLVAYFGLATWIGRGSTPGKALMRIQVVSLTHERLTLWHSIERALGYGASLLELGFGFLQYFIHPQCQTAHDRLAETIVVRRASVRK